MKRAAVCLALAVVAPPQAPPQAPQQTLQQAPDGALLRAMREELQRARGVRLPGVEAPYYIEFAVDEADSFSVSASQGALVGSHNNRMRVPRVQVRAGTPAFDNTNYVFSDLFGSRGGPFPLDDNILAIRHYFWLAADRAYKGAVEAIARKRAALRNVTQQETLNDFAKTDPLRLYLPVPRAVHERDKWIRLAKELSAIFTNSPRVTFSQVDYESGFGSSSFVNSEGSEFRHPDQLFYVRVRAGAQAREGMTVRDAVVFQSRTPEKLAPEVELRRAVTQIAANVTALLDAPLAEDYSGPVLVEGVAAPQLFAQLLGSNLGLTRRPVSEPGRPLPFPQSELEGRIGSRILPEWMDVVDDPVQQSWRGHELQGHYPVDMEAVVPAPLSVVEKGTLKNFLLTRLPVRGYEGSNGRARLPGAFGAKAGVFSNLFVEARETMTAAALRQKLLDLAGQRGKPFAMIIRKLDFPSSGSLDEIRRLSTAAGQRGGSVRPASLPVLVYRIYADGREELVRGLKFRSITVRSLRDIIAASDERAVFHFIGNGSPLPLMGGGGYVAGHSVVAPPVLFEDLELERREEDWPKLPLVAPPALVSSR